MLHYNIITVQYDIIEEDADEEDEDDPPPSPETSESIDTQQTTDS